MVSLHSEERLQTKVIRSFGGRHLDAKLAEKIAAEPADALRIVYNREYAQNIFDFIDHFFACLAPERHDDVAVMLDLSEGARAQIVDLAQAKDVAFGSKVRFSTEKTKADFAIKARYWDGLFKVGAFVFVGYGNAVLKTISVTADEAICEVILGGTVHPDMELHIPETRLQPTLKNLDRAVWEKLLGKNIDYIILPGVLNLNEFTELKELLASHTQELPWLILRIDSKQVYDKLPEFIDHVDGILISRRELALSIHPAQVAICAKEMIQLANDHAKLVFTASEMLGSMRRSPTPTRAEVSDVANAVVDGTDAVVLSEEVAQGRFGDRAIEVMFRIIKDTEQRTGESLNWIKLTPKIETEMDAVAYGAYTTAERVKAKAIVCVTIAGNTALRLASFRTPIPVVAVTFSERVLRKLALARGVEGIVLDVPPRIDEVLPVVQERLLRTSWLKPGDKIVFVSITLSSVGREASNIFTVQHLQ